MLSVLSPNFCTLVKQNPKHTIILTVYRQASVVTLFILMKLVKQRITRPSNAFNVQYPAAVAHTVQIHIKSNINICTKAHSAPSRWRCRTVIPAAHTVTLNSVRVVEQLFSWNGISGVCAVLLFLLCVLPEQPSNGERRRPPCRKYNTCAARNSSQRSLNVLL